MCLNGKEVESPLPGFLIGCLACYVTHCESAMQKDEPATASSLSGQDSAACDPGSFRQLVEHSAKPTITEQPACSLEVDASNCAPGQSLYGAYVDDFALIHDDWTEAQSDNLIDSTFLVGSNTHCTWPSMLLCSCMSVPCAGFCLPAGNS